MFFCVFEVMQQQKTDHRFDVLAESSTRRGAGFAVKARCPLHLNVTSALLDTLSDMQQQMVRLFLQLDAQTFRRRVEVVRTAQTAPGSHGQAGSRGKNKEAFGSRGGAKTGREDDQVARYRHREVVQHHEVFCLEWPAETNTAPPMGVFNGREANAGDSHTSSSLDFRPTPRFPVCHEFSAPLPLEARMPFTILNLTGQRTRYFQPRAGEDIRRLQYLRVREKGLEFL